MFCNLLKLQTQHLHMVVKMKLRRNKKKIVENVLPEDIERVEVTIEKVVTPKKATIDEVVEVTNMEQTKDVSQDGND